MVDLLKQYIVNKGSIIDNKIVKVDAFINHQIDTYLLEQIGIKISELYKDKDITKILTIETSGIPFGCLAALKMNYLPVVFAKKQKSLIIDDNCFYANVYSFTKQQEYQIRVAKEFINPNDKVLIIDDFLAIGHAAKGLINIVKNACAQVVGFCTIIEKRFQNGRENIFNEFPNVEVKALASIEKIINNQIYFNEE